MCVLSAGRSSSLWLYAQRAVPPKSPLRWLVGPFIKWLSSIPDNSAGKREWNSVPLILTLFVGKEIASRNTYESRDKFTRKEAFDFRAKRQMLPWKRSSLTLSGNVTGADVVLHGDFCIPPRNFVKILKYYAKVLKYNFSFHLIFISIHMSDYFPFTTRYTVIFQTLHCLCSSLVKQLEARLTQTQLIYNPQQRHLVLLYPKKKERKKIKWSQEDLKRSREPLFLTSPLTS